MLSCALYHGIFITTSWKCIRRKAHEEIISTLGDIQHKKGAPHITWEIVMLCLSKPKKKGKKRTYYCYCCRVCCKSEWTERATTSRAIVGLLRYVMCTKVIWLITLLLCLAVWKGDRSNLNSIEWIFSLVRYFSSTTWCITVSHLSRGPELTLSYISLVAAVPVIDYNTNSAPQHFFLLFLSVIVI